MHTAMDNQPALTDLAMAGPYLNDLDRTRHQNVIKSLAAETGRSFDDIMRHYEAALSDLGHDARIKDFLPIFVAKRVKEQFRMEAWMTA